MGHGAQEITLLLSRFPWAKLRHLKALACFRSQGGCFRTSEKNNVPVQTFCLHVSTYTGAEELVLSVQEANMLNR